MASWALTEWEMNRVDKVLIETKPVVTNDLIVVLGNRGTGTNLSILVTSETSWS